MAYIPQEKLLRGHSSLFKLVMAASRRATELSQGAAALVTTTSKKITTIALEEIAAGKVQFEAVAEGAKETQKEKKVIG